MQFRACERPVGSCRPTWPGVECHSPEDWPQLFIAMTRVPAGGPAHLYPPVGGLREHPGSMTTPGLYSPPGGAVPQRRWPFISRYGPVLFPGIDLAIWIKLTCIQRHLVLVVFLGF